MYKFKKHSLCIYIVYNVYNNTVIIPLLWIINYFYHNSWHNWVLYYIMHKENPTLDIQVCQGKFADKINLCIYVLIYVMYNI